MIAGTDFIRLRDVVKVDSRPDLFALIRILPLPRCQYGNPDLCVLDIIMSRGVPHRRLLRPTFLSKSGGATSIPQPSPYAV